MSKKTVVLVSVLLAGAICLPVLASSALRLTFDELVTQSDRVVVARATGMSSAWASDNRRIYTSFTFEIVEEIAGTGPGKFTVVQPGGRVGRWAQIVHGYPTFNKGDRVVLFLEEAVIGYQVVGMCQGVFGFYTHDHRDVIRQKLNELHFPGDAGIPLIMERQAAYERIRALFAERSAP